MDPAGIRTLPDGTLPGKQRGCYPGKSYSSLCSLVGAPVVSIVPWETPQYNLLKILLLYVYTDHQQKFTFSKNNKTLISFKRCRWSKIQFKKRSHGYASSSPLVSWCITCFHAVRMHAGLPERKPGLVYSDTFLSDS